jgi:hypothetical protein
MMLNGRKIFLSLGNFAATAAKNREGNSIPASRSPARPRVPPRRSRRSTQPGTKHLNSPAFRPPSSRRANFRPIERRTPTLCIRRRLIPARDTSLAARFVDVPRGSLPNMPLLEEFDLTGGGACDRRWPWHSHRNSGGPGGGRAAASLAQQMTSVSVAIVAGSGVH